MSAKKGMSKVDSLINGLMAVRDDMVFTIGEVVNRQEDAIIDGVLDNMWKGLDGRGLPIKPPYTNYTVKIKKRRGDPYDRVTLRDTGAFYDSMAVTNVGDGFMVMSRNTRDWHGDLPEKYGYSIFRPDPDSIYENIIVPLRAEIVKQIKSIKL